MREVVTHMIVRTLPEMVLIALKPCQVLTLTEVGPDNMMSLLVLTLTETGPYNMKALPGSDHEGGGSL
jgi:hypothetical protein